MRIRHQFLVLVAAVFCATRFAAAAPVSVSVSFFHEQLSPHGRWVTAASYGDVWIPSGVAAGWEPYVDGEWVYTDYGWTWMADDPWGDIPYHYGTWAWADPYGWCWVPGAIWAPAWVTWAYTDDYVGWAPVPPSFVLTASGYVGAPIVVASTRYVFVPTTRFVGVPVSTVRVAPAQNTTILARATKTTRFQVSNGTVRTAGPPTARIEKATGRPVERVSAARIKTPPTTLAAAGVSKGGRVHVVAPAKERAGLAASAEKKAPAKKEAAATRQAAKKEPATKEHVKKEAAPAHKAETHAQPAHPTQAKKRPGSAQKPETHTAVKPEKVTGGKPEKHTSGEKAATHERERAATNEGAAKPAQHKPPKPERAAPPVKAEAQNVRPETHASATEHRPPAAEHGAQNAPPKKASGKPASAKEKEPPKEKSAGRGHGAD
jgi:hypothetical protein